MYEIWKLKQARKKVYDSYDPQYKALRKKGAAEEELSTVDFQVWVDTQQFDEAIDRVTSRRICDEARELDVKIPGFDKQEMWTSSGPQKGWWLSSEGRAHLRKLIDEEKARRFEVKTRWVTKLILPLLVALIGIIGALTGLVAVLQHKK